MGSNRIRGELESRSVAQLRVLARQFNISYSGKRKAQLVDELLQADQRRLELMLGPLRALGKKELILLDPERWSIKQRGAVFLAVFGALWLLLEPVSAFVAGGSVFSAIGWWGYACLVGLSLVATGFSEYMHRKNRISSYELVSFFLVFPKSGHRLQITAPFDMQIEGLLRLMVTRLRGLLPVECAAMHLFTHNLMVKTEKGFRPLDSTLTLREAGVVEGTICRLRGYVRVEYTLPLLDIEYSWQPVRLELARADGLVVLDELDAVGYDEAKAKGILTGTAIARVDRFLHRQGGTVFVSMCPQEEIDGVPDLVERAELP